MAHSKLLVSNKKVLLVKTGITVCLLLLILVISSLIVNSEYETSVVFKFASSSSYDELINSVGLGDNNEVEEGKEKIKQSVIPITREERLKTFLYPELYKNFKENGNKALTQVINNSKSFGKFDKRLLPALWLHSINKYLTFDTADKTILPKDFSLPFNWDLLLDVSNNIQKSEYFEKIIIKKMNCKNFKDIAPNNQPETFLDFFCNDYNYENPNFVNEYNLPFSISRKVDQYLSDVTWRRIHGMIYALTDFPIPENVVFLGAIGQEGKLGKISENRALIIPLEKVSNGANDLTNLEKVPLQSYYETLSQNYIDDQLAKSSKMSIEDVLANGISVFDQLEKLNNQLKKLINKKSLLNLENPIPSYKPTRPTLMGKNIELLPKEKPVNLNSSDFQWYLPEVLENLKNEIETASEFESVDQLKHLLEWGELIADKSFDLPWYFGVASVENENLDHYDWRFFNNFTFLDNDKVFHTQVLHRLSRTWFRLCQQFDIPTWLNHGPLIGWYWNGLSLPYDFDLDLQLPIQSLHKLSKLLNNTLVYDFTDETDYVNEAHRIDNKAELGVTSYLFDVNPTYFDRNGIRSDKNNIDARLIDTETGIYIDITAVADFLSETEYDIEQQRKVLEKAGDNGYRMMIPPKIDQFFDETGDFYRDIGKADILRDELYDNIETFMESKGTDSRSEDSPTKKLFTDYVHCKHYHTYKISELSPLVPVYFENTLAYLPSNWYRNILIEYGSTQPMKNRYFKENKFIDDLRMWVDYNSCPEWDLDTGSSLGVLEEYEVAQECISINRKIYDEYDRTINYTTIHSVFRDAIKPKDLSTKGVSTADYETELKPILDKFTGNILKPNPWVAENLFN